MSRALVTFATDSHRDLLEIALPSFRRFAALHRYELLVTDVGLGRITPDDVDAVTERLKEWIPTLPEQEQLVLGWILTRAAAAEEKEVQAYAERTEGGVPVSSLMAEAAGIQDVSGYAQAAIDKIGPVKIWAFRW